MGVHFQLYLDNIIKEAFKHNTILKYQYLNNCEV